MSKIIIGTAHGQGNVGFDIDELLVSRLLVQANSGGGKSFLLRRMLEQGFGKVQEIVIDPAGEFATLREKYGFVLVGEHGETPADVRSAGLVAEKLLELRASAVCDLYSLKPHERHVWVRLFLTAVMNAPKRLWHPVLFYVDEAHKFCPEKGEGESEAKEMMLSLASDGRKYGFCAVWATQRLAKLDKSGASELTNVLIGPTFMDIDLQRAHKALGIVPREQAAFNAEMKTLAPGHFWTLGRAISKSRILVRVGGIATTHPTAGGKQSAEPPPPPDKIKALLPKLADLPQEAETKARTEAEFKREIRELKSKLSAASRQPSAKPAQPIATYSKPDPRAIERAVAAAVKPYREILRKIKQHADRADRSLPIVRGALEDIATATTENADLLSVTAQASERHPRDLPPVPAAQPRRPTALVAPDLSSSTNGSSPLTGPESKIMRALGELLSIGKERPSKNMVAAWASYSPIGGAFGNPIGALRSKGLIDYPAPGTVTLTEAGRAAIGPQSAPDQEEIWRRIEKTCTGPEQKILRALLDNAGAEEIAKEQLAEKAGYSPIGGAFGNPIGALRTKGLLDYPRQGVVKAADWLFL